MRFRYSYLRERFSCAPKQLALAAGLLVLPLSLQLEKNAAARPVAPSAPVKVSELSKPDPRTIRLTRFFSRLHCPVVTLSDEFVQAADDNQLDWRLLPSIAVVESGGGKAYRNNNIFGWDNGLDPFPSLSSAIRTVAFKLGRSPLYRNKDVVTKLRLYNPEDDTYVERVLTVMNRISPVERLQPEPKLMRRQQEFVYAAD